MTKPSLADMRKNYQQAELLETQAASNPLQQFTLWLEQALLAQIPEPNAMTLATVGGDLRPAVDILDAPDVISGEDKPSQAIRRAKTICVVGHVRPDGDCIGSQVGLALALQNRGYFSMLVTATDLGETVARQFPAALAPVQNLGEIVDAAGEESQSLVWNIEPAGVRDGRHLDGGFGPVQE